MILHPREYFTIVRQLDDPNDSGTYFVQAKIYNARTDTLLDTVNLTDRTGQRFSEPWQTPADPSGLGFYISISTRVYVDASYATLSDAYRQEIQTYLIDDRFRGMLGGGGSDVDYKKVRTIFKEVLADFNFPTVDLDPVLEAIKALGVGKILEWTKSQGEKMQSALKRLGGIREAVDAIEIPEMPEIPVTDLSPVLLAIDNIPEPEPVDLSGVEKGMEDLKKVLQSDSLKELITAADALQKVLDSDELKKAAEKIPELAGSTEKIEGVLKDFVYIMQKQGAPSEKKEEAPKIDYQAQARELMGRGGRKK